MDQKRRPRSLLILTALILLLNLIIPVSALAADTEPLPEHPDATVMQEGEIEELVRSVLAEYNVDESTVTVGFCYTATGECGYYNAGAYIYSASLYKLPLMMYYMERVQRGELSEDDYVGGYVLREVEDQILVYSKNDPATALLCAIGTPRAARQVLVQYSGMAEDDLPEEYYTSSFFSAEYMLGVLKTLYYHSEDYPHVIELMKQAQPGRYMRLELEGEYEIAQKYGSYRGYRHAAGILYTPNPVLVTVMTNGGASGETIVGQVAEKLSEYAVVLDERLETELSRPVETPEPEPETPEPEPETPEPEPETPEPVPTNTPVEEPVSAVADTGNFFAPLPVVLTAALVTGSGVIILNRKRK